MSNHSGYLNVFDVGCWHEPVLQNEEEEGA